jgi:hypothetical protein
VCAWPSTYCSVSNDVVYVLEIPISGTTPRFTLRLAHPSWVNVKLVSKTSVGTPEPLRSPAVCRAFFSEPPRTRTWNLEIKSLCRGVSVRFRALRIWCKYAESFDRVFRVVAPG